MSVAVIVDADAEILVMPTPLGFVFHKLLLGEVVALKEELQVRKM